MATAGISGLIDLYTMQADDLTAQISELSIDLVQAAKQAGNLATETSDKKEFVKLNYEDDEGEIPEEDREDYNYDISDIQDEYELKLEVIQEWETDLQNKQNEIETQLQEVNSYKSSYTSALKQNIGVDFKFGASNS